MRNNCHPPRFFRSLHRCIDESFPPYARRSDAIELRPKGLVKFEGDGLDRPCHDAVHACGDSRPRNSQIDVPITANSLNFEPSVGVCSLATESSASETDAIAFDPEVCLLPGHLCFHQASDRVGPSAYRRACPSWRQGIDHDPVRGRVIEGDHLRRVRHFEPAAPADRWGTVTADWFVIDQVHDDRVVAFPPTAEVAATRGHNREVRPRECALNRGDRSSIRESTGPANWPFASARNVARTLTSSRPPGRAIDFVAVIVASAAG